MNLFSFVYPQFKFGKTINVIECFSGIGTQAMALKRLAKKHDLEINIMAISEIDKYAIQSYEAIHGKVNNLGGIGSFDRFPSGVDLCTWSFPCQDISLAGKQKGMKDGTRSNYGYEFLDTVKRTPYNERPKVLLMENVPALVSEKFKDDYTEIHYRLEQLGYTSWGGLMNAKDYGIPQNRERIFVLSFLGEYAYTFPRPIKLKTRLKDYLEPIVDEKYYLSQKLINTFTAENTGAYPRKERFINNITRENQNVANAITTRAGSRPIDNFVVEPIENFIAIPEKTKKGYAIAKEGDGVYINRLHQKRGVVQKDMIQTIKTAPNDVGVVVKDTRNLKEKLADNLIETGTVKGGEIINHSYTNSKQRPELVDFIESNDGIMPTLTTRSDILGVVAIDNKELRIRKLTPRETWRLMGIDDNDFNKAQASGISDAQLYKQAGNAIVVNVLEALLKEMI